MNSTDKDPADRAAPGTGAVESIGSAPVPQESFGSAPGGDGEFGSTPGPTETIGDAPSPAPTPAPAGNRNVPLMVGGGIAILVILVAIFGFLLK